MMMHTMQALAKYSFAQNGSNPGRCGGLTPTKPTTQCCSVWASSETKQRKAWFLKPTPVVNSNLVFYPPEQTLCMTTRDRRRRWNKVVVREAAKWCCKVKAWRHEVMVWQ
jgi:hypothetical protein